MAVRSLINIDVNASGFNQFQATFNRYQQVLRGQPAIWAQVNSQISASRATFDQMVAGMVQANIQAKLLGKAQETADKLTRTSFERWQGIARASLDFARNIKDATFSLLRLGGLGTAIAGLVGGGSVFGIDRLAAGVGSTRRSALGIGATYGEVSAAGNLGAVVDPMQFLSRVGAAQHDLSQRIGLISGGLTPGQIQGTAGNAAAALLQNIKKIADNTNPAMNAQIIQARRLPVSLEEFTRIQQMSKAEIGEWLALFRQQGRSQNVADQDALKYQKFLAAIENAGNLINKSFVEGLLPLIPGLTKLSTAVGNVVTAFLRSPALSKWIGDVGDALETFAGYIGTQEFQSSIEKFVTGVVNMAETIGKWFGGGTGATAATPAEAARKNSQGLFGQEPETAGQARFNRMINRGLGTDVKVAPQRVPNVTPPDDTKLSAPPRAGARRGPNTFDTNEVVLPADMPPAGIAEDTTAAGYLNRNWMQNRSQLPPALPVKKDEGRYVNGPTALDGHAPAVVRIENATGGNAAVIVNGVKGD